MLTDSPNAEMRMEQIWKGAWKVLNWKYRSPTHYEAYWKLLHKRPRKVVNLGVEGKHDYTTGTCRNCNQPDDTRHVYFNCPAVHKIWLDAIEILRRLLGSRTLQIDCPILEIILAFPDLRSRLPKDRRMRIIYPLAFGGSIRHHDAAG